jgi:hypothetical protein
MYFCRAVYSSAVVESANDALSNHTVCSEVTRTEILDVAGCLRPLAGPRPASQLVQCLPVSSKAEAAGSSSSVPVRTVAVLHVLLAEAHTRSRHRELAISKQMVAVLDGGGGAGIRGV